MDTKQTEKKYVFNVKGMHCNACVLLTESELGDHPNVSSVKSNLNNRTVEVCGDFEGQEIPAIVEELNKKLSQHSLSTEKQENVVKWSDFKIALPIALVFLVLFIVLQKIGLINIVGSGDVTYGTAFVIGIVASLSTCMAVVGGLVLSMSATFAKEGDKFKPQLMFHVGRIVSFFVLGGIIGALGSAFTLNTGMSFALSLLIGIIMLVLGLNLLDVFPSLKKLQPSMPKFISKHALGVSKLNHTLTPLLIGVATFFLPCGFTQSMQIFTLSTGSFMTGGLTMLSFVLGTLPALALVSFSSFSIQNSSKAGIFFKTAGLIVIIFALFNLINSLVVIGLISPIFNF
ncbi:MAG: sulfite exporter TauE/SafE family protein [Candidatus Paceibacterota bacterium]